MEIKTIQRNLLTILFPNNWRHSSWQKDWIVSSKINGPFDIQLRRPCSEGPQGRVKGLEMLLMADLSQYLMKSCCVWSAAMIYSAPITLKGFIHKMQPWVQGNCTGSWFSRLNEGCGFKKFRWESVCFLNVIINAFTFPLWLTQTDCTSTPARDWWLIFCAIYHFNPPFYSSFL